MQNKRQSNPKQQSPGQAPDKKLPARQQENRQLEARLQAPKQQARPQAKPEAKKRRRSYSDRVVIFLLFIFVLAYITNSVILFFNKPKTPLSTIQYGKIDDAKIYDGIAVRDERIYRSNTEGLLSFMVNDLTRVKPGEVICTISDKNSVAKLESELDSINKNILNTQKMRSEISIVYEDVKRANKQIKELVDENVFRFSGQNFESLYSFESKLEQSVDFRNRLLLSDNKGSLKSYSDSRSVYLDKISNSTAIFKSEESGLVSYVLDGLEEALTFDKILNLTKEQTHMSATGQKLTLDKSIKAEVPMFKIIHSNEWYIASYIDNDMAGRLKENQRKTIYIDKNSAFHPIEVTIHKIVPAGHESYVLLRSTKNMIDYIDMRSIRFKTEEGSHWGYKIPKSAIVDKTLLKIPAHLVSKENTVLKKTTEGVEKVQIIHMGSDDLYTYASMDFNLKLNDTCVEFENNTKEYVLSEVETTKGILFSNYGYADFKKITVSENDYESNGYILLNPALNKSIQLGDKIISDARLIQDGAKIY